MSPTGIKLVVIGSNSFSGASFANHCMEVGIDVLGISRSEEPNDVFLPYRGQETGSFQFLQAHLVTDQEKMIDAIAGFEPEYVVNFAAQGMVAESWLKPGDWYNTNTTSNIVLHDQLRQLGSIRKYVHISTPEVYGNTEGLIKESNSYAPSTPYATSRAACDLSLQNFFENYDFPVVWTRAANVYGPGQQLYRIIPRTIMAIRTGEKLQLHGGGESVRSFIHIRDVAEVTLQIAKNAHPGNIYHLSTKVFVSIRELVEMICKQMDADFASVVDVVEERAGKDHAYLLDSSKAEDEFQWKPRITLEDGIRETIKWVDQNLDVLSSESLTYTHKS